MTCRVREEGYQHLGYKMVEWVKTGEIGILNYISEPVTLVQNVYTAGDFNHALIIIVCWIYYSN